MSRARVITGMAASALSVLAAHHLAYLLTVKDADARAHLLEHSGHGWWAYAPVLAGVALTFVAAGLASTRKVHTHRVLPLLAPALYAVVEVAERLLSGGEHGLVHVPTLLVGSLIASTMGLLAAALLRHIEKYVLERRRRSLFAACNSFPAPSLPIIADWSLRDANGERAPPR